eukprot:s2326_g15.t1
MLKSFRQKRALDPIQELCLVALFRFIFWLALVCRRMQLVDVYLLNMWGQGKHRSMYASRLSFVFLRLVLSICQIEIVDLTFEWDAEERVTFEVFRNRALLSTLCSVVILTVQNVLVGWKTWFGRVLPDQCRGKFAVVELTDALHAAAYQEPTELEVAKCMENPSTARARWTEEVNLHFFNCWNAMHTWPFGAWQLRSMGVDERQSVLVVQLRASGNLLKSWLFFCRVAMRRLWPQDCSLCCAGHVGHCAPWDWQHSLTSYFRNLIVETWNQLPRQQVQLIAAPDAECRRQWADMAEEESDSDGAQSTAWQRHLPKSTSA